MMLRHVLGLGGVLLVLATATAACNQPQRRNDWRTPAPPAMTAPSEQPPFLPTDGGAPPSPAAPTVQPSSSDIQI